jgi:hypothetical protein
MTGSLIRIGQRCRCMMRVGRWDGHRCRCARGVARQHHLSPYQGQHRYKCEGSTPTVAADAVHRQDHPIAHQRAGT